LGKQALSNDKEISCVVDLDELKMFLGWQNSVKGPSSGISEWKMLDNGKISAVRIPRWLTMFISCTYKM
jgi:hypothetical protein